MGQHGEYWELVIIMARDDWFRNRQWTPEIETKFFDKLARARNIGTRGQYLRIQAVSLIDSLPDVSLRLLDKYFGLGDHFEAGLAHRIRGDARRALGQMQKALDDYDAALKHDKTSNFKSGAELSFALLVAEEKVSSQYERAMTLANPFRTNPTFPVERFLACAVRAIIFSDTLRHVEAADSASEALTAAGIVHSGFRYHPTVGLVGSRHEALIGRMRQLLDSRGRPNLRPN